MKTTMQHVLLTFTLSLALAACAAQDPVDPVETTIQESALTCTPDDETCDWGCGWVGGPSTNDCIVRCNAAGTGYIEIEDCGWAQNFPYSSSCFDTSPHPVCVWN